MQKLMVRGEDHVSLNVVTNFLVLGCIGEAA